ncbi:hypothetical protein KDA_60400 [Dictyobacter alpinus]|uniref:DoxX family protein n=1 Tax=Dictyobacter alpinus TaxID=2014873 RepID=A0A402BGT6_9CHLR|nr:DoxX family protein [Dictyobacter alpinus]GCE30556.1 hypothetical protein KDA_60400 [Dictyobacter alpinus]
MKFFSFPTDTMVNTGLLLLRLTLFAVFIVHGSQKVLGWFGGHGFQATLTGFTNGMQIPLFLAVIAILTEFLAPLALLLGLLTRLAALGLLCVVVVAMTKVHLANGFFMNWAGHQKGEGVEFFILAIGIALALIVCGAGSWSLDTLIAGRSKQTKTASVVGNISTVPQGQTYTSDKA